MKLTITVAVAGLSIVTILVLRNWGAHPVPIAATDASSYVDAHVGDTVCRPDGKPWAPPGVSRIIISVGSSSCGLCAANKPFEEEVFERSAQLHIPFYYILANTPGNDPLAASLKASGRLVLRAQLHDFGVMRTPTMMTVSETGAILNLWIGTVPAGKHDDVVNGLISGEATSQYTTIPASTFNERCTADSDCQVLALSSMGQDPVFARKTRRIPAGQLAVRGRYELVATSPVFVDCRTAVTPFACQEAVVLLTKLDFTQIVAVGLPSGGHSCGLGTN